MPIRSLIKDDNKVLIDLTLVLTKAFDNAWAKFKASGNPLAGDGCSPSTRALLAKRIIETATKGERDANRLAEDGVLYLSELK
jgi:hypothetical protein